jgi:DNA-binding response OmpR family regulator
VPVLQVQVQQTRAQGESGMTAHSGPTASKVKPATLPSTTQTVRIGSLVLTPGDPRVVVGGSVIYLPPQNLVLLQLLAEQPGRVVSAATLARGLTRARAPLSVAAVAVHVHHLRARLRPSGLSIRTVRRSGYVLEVR